MLIRWNELSYPDLGAYRDQAAVMINFASTERSCYCPKYALDTPRTTALPPAM